MLWEAQYGDFINGAQVILDEFVTSGRAKWGLTPSLVFLLPHGYEGQGPDHSSARLERFLQSAADTNMRIANCTTAAQYFHLLRRQALLLETDPLPLVVLTPKSLLRHPLTASSPRELAEGRFQLVIDDEEARTAGGQGPAAGALQRQDLRRSRLERAAQGGRRASRWSASSSSIRSRSDELRAVLDALSEAARSVLGAGRAGEHGRVGVRAAAARAARSTAAGRCATSAAPATRAPRKDPRRGTRSTSAPSSRRRSKKRRRRYDASKQV